MFDANEFFSFSLGRVNLKIPCYCLIVNYLPLELSSSEILVQGWGGTTDVYCTVQDQRNRARTQDPAPVFMGLRDLQPAGDTSNSIVTMLTLHLFFIVSRFLILSSCQPDSV